MQRDYRIGYPIDIRMLPGMSNPCRVRTEPQREHPIRHQIDVERLEEPVGVLHTGRGARGLPGA